MCGQGGMGGASECKRDQSGSPILSPAFFCSAGVRGEPDERFIGRFFYEGIPFQAFGAKTTDNRRGINIYITAGPNAMPGGRWGCELGVGPERVKNRSGALARRVPSSTWLSARARARSRPGRYGFAAVTSAAPRSRRPNRSPAAPSSSEARASSQDSSSCARARTSGSARTSRFLCRSRPADPNSIPTRGSLLDGGRVAGRSQDASSQQRTSESAEPALRSSRKHSSRYPVPADCCGRRPSSDDHAQAARPAAVVRSP